MEPWKLGPRGSLPGQGATLLANQAPVLDLSPTCKRRLFPILSICRGAAVTVGSTFRFSLTSGTELVFTPEIRAGSVERRAQSHLIQRNRMVTS